jgi:hypothetical protein
VPILGFVGEPGRAEDRTLGSMPDNDKLRSRGCECGATDCARSWEEQDRVDHDGRNLFVVAVGHELAGPEKSVVVSRSDRFAVIEIDAS